MSIPLDSIPRFDAEAARAAAEVHFGIRGEISALPSERDQNFLVAARDGSKYVLKIANSRDGSALLDFQNQAMHRVDAAGVSCRVQRPLKSRRGREVEEIRARNTGRPHGVRLLTWIDGQMLARTAARAAPLLESIGVGLAGVDRALRDFAHPAMQRVLQWDLRHANLARAHLPLLPEARRAQIERHFASWAALDWTRLRHSVIHGDANDHNVLVDGGRMHGLLDFGDMVFTATACELAIALAYTLLGEREPLATAAPLVRAYLEAHPLTGAERRALPVLVLSRLSMSVCYSAHNRARNPGDPYQVVSESAAWELLDRLEPHAADGSLAF